MSVRFKPIDPVRLKSAVLRASYFEFVKAFWPVVVAETPVWNWHIEYIAGEIQEVLERIFVGKPKEHDLIDNQPPGTSKSLVFSVFQLPWAWTRMPSLRFIGASYSHPLAMQLSRLSRDVVKSDLYRLLFPEVQIRQDQDTKAYFANTAGGTRYAVGANGSVTGLHAHVICIPYEVPVTTDRGDLPIGYVVENRLPVKLLTFDHAAGRTRWQQVQSYGKAPGRPVCKIEFTDGTGLECTHDHPVWNETLGQYVDAETLTPGTQVLYVRRDAAVLHLPEARGPEVVEPEEESGPAGVLRQALLRPVDQCEQDGEEPRPVRQPEAEVRGVREDDRGRTVPGEVQPVLLDEVSGGAAGRDAFPVGRAGQAGVSRVRRGRSGGAVSGGARAVLLQGVCGPGTLGSDDAGEEPAVPGRVLDLSGQPLPAGVHGQTQEPGQGPGEPAVLHLPGGARGRDGAGGPPRRLRQGAQPDAEPGRGLPGVSRGVTRDGVAAPPVGRKTVARVIPHIRLPAAVYNFDVTGDHNYFAAGVLVHNCIDDPLNPNEAASKTQLQQTNFWIGKTLLSRKVDKAVSVVELVMQRLDEDDPTTLMLDKGGCRHLCFPAELHAGYKVKPASAARYYAGGLFDATRLPKKALDESRKELGDVGYCTPGYSPVLMADWTEKSIEDVKVGDRVVGFVSEPAPKRGKSASRVVKARVVAVQSRHAEVVRMVMASGREVYCTPDHNWWNRFSPGEVAAGRKKMYSPAKIGKRMWSVYQPLDDPTPEQQRDYDWLGGIIDGEGACKHAGSGINIYQSHTANPEVCQKIGETLRRLDLDYSRYKIDTYHASRPGGRQSTVYHLAGDRTTKMRLLKNCKLVKRFQIVRHMWDRPFKVADRKDHVKEIHKVGKMKVHALTTTTGNYVVWGFASSNSGQYGQNPVPPGGAMFDVTQLTLHDAAQPLPRFVKEVRFWDKAATTEKEDSRAAFTTGVRLARTADGLTYVRDVRRGRWNTAVREKVIRTQARRDGSPVDVGLEQEPGSGGKESALKTKRMLRGHRVHVVRPTGDKVQRAVPFSVEVNMGRVVLVPGPWNKEYVRELMHFPFGRFKDQVDASAGANSLLDGGLRKAGGIRSKKKTEEIYDPAPPRKKIEKDDD